MSVAKPFRAEDWWVGKASSLIGLVYLLSIYYRIPFALFGVFAACSLVTIVGFASLGYLVERLLSTLKKISKRTKKIFVLNTSTIQKTAYFSIAILLVFAPWYLFTV
jgi:hypothetical protein